MLTHNHMIQNVMEGTNSRNNTSSLVVAAHNNQMQCAASLLQRILAMSMPALRQCKNIGSPVCRCWGVHCARSPVSEQTTLNQPRIPATAAAAAMPFTPFVQAQSVSQSICIRSGMYVSNLLAQRSGKLHTYFSCTSLGQNSSLS